MYDPLSAARPSPLWGDPLALRTRLTTGLPFRGDRPKRPLPPSRAWHSNPRYVGLRHRTGPKRIPKLKCNKTGTQPLPDRNNEWARTPTWRYEPFRASAKGPKLPYLFGRGGGTRTHTPCQDPDFKSGASADSATPPRFLFLQVSVVLWQLGQRRRTLSLVQSPPALFGASPALSARRAICRAHKPGKRYHVLL